MDVIKENMLRCWILGTGSASRQSQHMRLFSFDSEERARQNSKPRLIMRHSAHGTQRTEICDYAKTIYSAVGLAVTRVKRKVTIWVRTLPARTALGSVNARGVRCAFVSTLPCGRWGGYGVPGVWDAKRGEHTLFQETISGVRTWA
jgi:hypothetical protein